MTPQRSLSRLYVACLFVLAAVLVLGIVQWSFLPVLNQNGPGTAGTALEFSASHTSKFAAPFKALHGDGWIPRLIQTRINLQRAAFANVRPADAPTTSQCDFSLTHRPLRAPPSA
jgi:hypothetical protein